MQWTKISTKYAELMFSDASDSVFRTYIRLMLLVSSMEVAPNLSQISTKLGKRKVQSLMKYIEQKEKELGKDTISLTIIINKVMEDVNSVLKQREHGKMRQKKHRVTRYITEQDKIREEKSICIVDKSTKNTSSKFIKPSLTDLKKYIEEGGYKVVPETFYDWYESNGWRVGKNPMKDWKACVRNWHNKDNTKGGGYAQIG